MKFRILAVFIFLILPLSASADDISGSAAQTPQSSVGASELGPQGSNSGGVSSTNAASLLQPNISTLQGSSGDGSSLSAPADQPLQAAPASDGLKVLLGGEADGSPKNLNDQSTSSFGEDLTSIALGVLILCIALVVLRRRVKQTIFEI